MARLFYGNFQFETELRTGMAVIPSASLRDGLIRRWAWLAVAESGDFVVGPDDGVHQVEPESATGIAVRRIPRDAVVGRRTEFVPWGWSKDAFKVGKSWGSRVLAPTPESVLDVNRRSTRAGLERQLGAAPPGMMVGCSVDEVAAAISQILAERANGRFDWILKAEFGMAGREAIRGNGPLSDPRQIGWVQKRLSQSQCVVVEPWLEAIQEGSLQFDVPLRGSPRYLGTTMLGTDGTGAYRSSRVGDPAAAEFAPALPVCQQAAECVQELGYWGPLGIDVMLARIDGGTWVRAIQDLNARWTMGRLALEEWKRSGRTAPLTWQPPDTGPVFH